MNTIKDRVYNRLKFKENPDVVFVEKQGVYVSYTNGKAEIASGENHAVQEVLRFSSRE